MGDVTKRHGGDCIRKEGLKRSIGNKILIVLLCSSILLTSSLTLASVYMLNQINQKAIHTMEDLKESFQVKGRSIRFR